MDHETVSNRNAAGYYNPGPQPAYYSDSKDVTIIIRPGDTLEEIGERRKAAEALQTLGHQKWQKWREHEKSKTAEFQHDCLVAHGLDRHPMAEEILRVAGTMAYASGEDEPKRQRVYFLDAVERLAQIIKASASLGNQEVGNQDNTTNVGDSLQSTET